MYLFIYTFLSFVRACVRSFFRSFVLYLFIYLIKCDQGLPSYNYMREALHIEALHIRFNSCIHFSTFLVSLKQGY